MLAGKILDMWGSHSSVDDCQVFWYFTCRLVHGYQRFGGVCCLHLQGSSSALSR